MLLSDYCTSPISNTLSLISPTSSVYPTAQYYLTCLSNNNLQNPFIPIEHDLNSAIMIINSTAKACQLPKIRTDMYASIKSSLAESAQINNNIQCNNISSTVISILEEDICNQIFTGVFIIWVSHFFTLAGLYIALLVTSIICQNYGRFWNFIDGKEVPFQPTADAKKSNKTALASTKSKSGRQDGNPESGADESGAADDADADDSEPADPMDIRISTRRPISTGYGMTGDDEGRYTVKQTMNPNASTLISSMSRNITPKSNPSSPTSGNVMSLASQSNLLTRPMSRSKQVPLNVQSAPDDINGIVYKI